MNAKKYYFVYETTCLVNNKKYRGAHSSDDLNDGYLGSGKLIMEAVKEFGEENFERKIIALAANWEHLQELEREYVNSEWLARDDIYNMRRGGSLCNENFTHSIESRKKMSAWQKGRTLPTKHRANISKSIRGRVWMNNGKDQAQCKPERAEKLKNEGWVRGPLPRSKNAKTTKGFCWLNNGEEQRYCKPEEAEKLKNKGWVPGILYRKKK